MKIRDLDYVDSVFSAFLLPHSMKLSVLSQAIRCLSLILPT